MENFKITEHLGSSDGTILIHLRICRTFILNLNVIYKLELTQICDSMSMIYIKIEYLFPMSVQLI